MKDADWNVILRDFSEGATGRQARRSELLEGFGEVPEEVLSRNIFPKMRERSGRARFAEEHHLMAERQ